MAYELYLVHHGIKGQQWGVRNGPPYPLESGRGIKKALKRNENRVAKAYHDYQKYSALDRRKKIWDGALKKATGVDASNPAKYKDKIDDAQRRIKEGESATWKLLAAANTAGYTVETYQTNKLKMSYGKQFVANALAAIPGSLIYNAVSLDAQRVPYNKYKVYKSDKPELVLRRKV